MSFRSPSIRLVAICELLTAAWSLYMVIHGMGAGIASPVSFADYLLRVVVAVLIADAVWKRKGWAPIAVVVFAAYIGIPTLIRVFGQTLVMWKVGFLPSSDLWRDAGDLVQKLAQLVALVGGLHELTTRRSAA